MQKSSNRLGRTWWYHGYTLSQAQKILDGKEKIIDEPYISPSISQSRSQRLKKSPPKTLQDIIANKKDYVAIQLDAPLKRKWIIS